MINVKITLKGLGVTCFNEKSEEGRRAEIAFLGCKNHYLTITVLKGKETIERLQPEPKKRIEIRSEGSKIDGFEINNDGNFNRRSPDNDSKDFRWILDLEGAELHNRQLRPKKQSQIPITPMYIYNATFGTARKTSFDLHLVELINKRPKFDINRLGPIGDEVEAVIKAKSVTLRLEGNREIVLEDKGKYEIIVDNRCDLPEDGSSDFFIYYDILRDPTGRQFSIGKEIVEKKDKKKKIVAKNTPLACNIVELGITDTIEGLLN